jgi:hypothetical protein
MRKDIPRLSSKLINRSCVYLSAIALLLGGIIYILFRTSEPVLLHRILEHDPSGWLSSARNKAFSITPYLPAWFVFSLPDGLWAFVYALVITAIWNGSKSPLKYIWMASIPLLVIGFEFLQYLKIIPGTFCFLDLAFGLAGIITGIMTGSKTIKPDYHENAFD